LLQFFFWQRLPEGFGEFEAGVFEDTEAFWGLEASHRYPALPRVRECAWICQ
jgi:hypothetical protein